jgi:hypothetical protein
MKDENFGGKIKLAPVRESNPVAAVKATNPIVIQWNFVAENLHFAGWKFCSSQQNSRELLLAAFALG